jgi:E1A-binding protein p400
LQRIASLRREGLWSIKRLPKLCEPKRPKAHWDYLLDEMMWMSNDFQQERKWKKAVSKKISGAVQKYFKDKEIKAEMAEKEELKRMRKNAANIAREIMNFWRNVEKVVEYKLKTIDEEKRKKELDMHLNFIVDQTEKYSSRLMKGLSTSSTDNVNNNKQTVVEDEQTEEEYEDAIENINEEEEEEDEEYDEENDSDDAIDNESTIESDEDINNYDVNEEIRQLQMDSELPIEDLITKQYFDESHSIEMNKEEEEDDDSYTEDSNETTDVEDTIEEEENYQQNNEKYNVDDELKQLEED